MIKKIRQDERGVILVITLIIMAIFLSIAIGFGTVVISDIRQAGAIDDSIVAYFAAEAGIERNLFLLRRQDDISKISQISNKNQTLDQSQASWNVASSTDFETTFFRQRIKNGQGVKLFFLERAQGNNVSAIKIFWDKSPEIATKMQVSFTRLSNDLNENIFITDLNKVVIATSTDCYAFEKSDTDYVVDIKALGPEDGFIDKLTILGYSSDGCIDGTEEQTAISNITLVAEGEFGNSTQNIIAHLPPRTPVSGIFNFVLFSEQDITKK